MKALTKTETTKLLDKDIFNVPMNASLVHQVATSQMSRRRQVIAHTKGKGDVSGGGRKPWRQKGTGRARHGSIRSPIWIGGGVTFGPTNERNFKKDLPKKMRRKALFMVLSQKLEKGTLIVIDDLNMEEIKTSVFDKEIKALSLKGSILMALPENDEKIVKSARNIQNIDTIQAKDLNCLDLLNHKNLIITKTGLEKLKETFF